MIYAKIHNKVCDLYHVDDTKGQSDFFRFQEKTSFFEVIKFQSNPLSEWSKERLFFVYKVKHCLTVTFNVHTHVITLLQYSVGGKRTYFIRALFCETFFFNPRSTVLSVLL